jgi:hypothetical protein
MCIIRRFVVSIDIVRTKGNGQEGGGKYKSGSTVRLLAGIIEPNIKDKAAGIRQHETDSRQQAGGQ